MVLLGQGSDPLSDSVVRLGRNSYRIRSFIGLRQWFPVATDRILELSPMMDRGVLGSDVDELLKTTCEKNNRNNCYDVWLHSIFFNAYESS